MPVEAKVICDSLGSTGTRLTTVEVKLHRFVLAELNTHRMFSRNSASSRAIPVEKMIQRAIEDPAIPLHWGQNQKGMQANEELPGEAVVECRREWLYARNDAVNAVRKLINLGLHKQVANRLLEPFMWHTVIISATEWDNFFAQRCHAAAQPEMRAAAEAIRAVIEASNPVEVGDGWHLPYVSENEGLSIELAKKISVARCARVSCLTQDGVRDTRLDLELHDRLASAAPPHASPFEHVATPAPLSDHLPGNFRGWMQLRHRMGI